ncbi:MAG: hypothetical protein WCJ30_26220 [Deltaproteobacteria bacterium]
MRLAPSTPVAVTTLFTLVTTATVPALAGDRRPAPPVTTHAAPESGYYAPRSAAPAYTSGAFYAPAASMSVYGAPLAGNGRAPVARRLPGGEGRIATEPRGTNFAAFIGGAVGLAGNRAPALSFTMHIGTRVPSALEYGFRFDSLLPADLSDAIVLLGAGTFVALHPLAFAHHHRFDPSVAVGLVAVMMSRHVGNSQFPLAAGIEVPVSLSLDVLIAGGQRLGVYGEIDVLVPADCFCTASERAPFVRASFGLRLVGGLMR